MFQVKLIRIDQKTAPDSWNHGQMGKRKNKKQSAKATLAEVIKEMAKPRVARSARGQSSVFWNEVLVVENSVKK